ncbi:MAG: endonuclease III [Methanomassiliicoccales archaeon]|jgi:endonuclease-3|nr:endonuclease III [Methanomassiliicoccales archaeon]
MKPIREILTTLVNHFPNGAFPGRKGEERPAAGSDPFQVLISTVLSQRTKDENTYVASQRLFSKYKNPAELAAAPLDDLMELIRPAGFPKAKSKAIKEIARIIHQDYNDRVPNDMEKLLALPLVGRKTANCVLVYGFGQDAIPVDVHVHRISNRIGLVSTRTPGETEMELTRVVPRDLWKRINTVLIAFGKEICTPRNPNCSVCPINRYCDYFAEKRTR